MTEYLPAADATAILDAECGSEDFSVTSHGELWSVANLPATPYADGDRYLDVGIERVDVPEEYGFDASGFEDDDDAVAHVQRMADGGSVLHARALRINHAADSLRANRWGDENVHRRTWPEPEPA